LELSGGRALLMFSVAHNLYSLCSRRSDRKYTIVILGIDNAGKTTLVNTLKGEVTDPEAGNPTFGTSRSLIQLKSAHINFVDIGGGKNMRNYWKDLFCEAHGVIFMVDSTDPQRFEEARSMLFESVQHSMLENKPLLVMMNKRDLPEAVAEQEVAQALNLDQLKCPTWRAQKCIATRLDEAQEVDAGVAEGLEWLSEAVFRNFSEIDERVECDKLIQQQKEVEERARKKAERERRKKEREEREAAEAESAALAACEAGEVAVPMQVSNSPAKQEVVDEPVQKGMAPDIDSKADQSEVDQGAVDSSESAPAASEDKAELQEAPEVAGTPPPPLASAGRLKALPPVAASSHSKLPELKGVPPRLEPLTVSPEKRVTEVITDSPLAKPHAENTSKHPHVPLSPDPSAPQ